MEKSYDLLLEIGCEEIPSRFMAGSLGQLREEAIIILRENRLEQDDVVTWGTPRRLVIAVAGLSSGQSDLVETVKGPPVNRSYDQEGNPTRALQGFMQGQGVTLEQLEEETIKGAPYVTVRREIKGLPTDQLLPQLLPRLIQKLNFPRPMFWQSKETRFARPIRWILALYKDSPVYFSFAAIDSGSETYGHRFLAPGPFEVDSIDDYFQRLAESYVVLDQDRRRAMIREQLAAAAAEKGGKALIDSDLLEEVIYLVEYPVAADGFFDRSFLDLPQEVLVTTMQHHQRYFPIAEKDGDRLMPHFVGISNNLFHPNIRKGYSKVLQARLADARFFFNEDRKNSLESYVEKLSGVIFLKSLGTLEEKRERLVELTGRLGAVLDLGAPQIDNAKRVAHLCKADLVTGMVKEFTDLQGIMGREYARLSGEKDEIATGIYEHYLPRFAGDDLPTSIAGALVSLADRIDTLTGCFAIGLQPTGSQDPYGLRRQAQGAVAILLGFALKLSPVDYIDQAIDLFSTKLDLQSATQAEVRSSLIDFLLQRIRFVLQDRNISHDVTEAVLAVPFSNLDILFRRALALQANLKEPLLDAVITAYNRAANLARNSEGGTVDEELFEDGSEGELYARLIEVEEEMLASDDPLVNLESLRRLKDPLDRFFDSVMVMAEDHKVRENRLNLLAALKKLFNGLADFSKLQAP